MLKTKRKTTEDAKIYLNFEKKSTQKFAKFKIF